MLLRTLVVSVGLAWPVSRLGAEEAPGSRLSAAEAPAGGVVPIQVLPDAVPWGPGPSSLPPGVRMAVLEGNPAVEGLFTMRVEVPADYLIPPHRHPESERVTVLAGSVHVGFGERVDRTTSTRFPTGSFYVNPPGAAHFVWTDEATVLQITGLGPWQLEYVDPNADPRKKKP